MIENQIIDEDQNAFKTPTIDENLKHFIAENADDNYATTYTLYRRMPAGSGKKFTWLKKFHDEPPEMEYIADTWGADDYRLTIVYYHKAEKKIKTSSINFSIDPEYNADKITKQNLTSNNYIGNDNSIKIMQTMAQQQQQMMLQFVQMITGIMGNMNTGKNNSIEILTDQMSNVLMKSFQQQLSLVNEVGKQQLINNQALPPAPPEKEQPDWIGTIIQLWEKYGKQLLNAPKNFQDMAASHIQNDPVFQQMLSSPENFDTAYNTLSDRYGTENVDKMLNILNVNLENAEIVSEN